MKKIEAAIAVTVAIVLVGFGAWSLTDSQHTSSGVHRSIIVGMQPFEYASLLYIAENQGYFAGNGLNVTIREYESGAVAIKGMEKGDVDISLSTEYPVVTAALQRANISAIGNICKFQTWYLIGRKDRGIECVSDLRGKKIGIPSGTIGEFYLGRFLNLHGISKKDVTLVNIPLSKSPDAIVNGDVDAVIVLHNYVDPIVEGLSGDIKIWPGQNGQAADALLACRNAWIAGHSESINRFLKALDQAEAYTIKHQDEAKAIVQKKLNYSDAYMAAMWPNQQFSLTLDQSLLIAMNDEGRWTIDNNLSGGKTMPNFRDYIYTKGLEQVKPESINIR